MVTMSIACHSGSDSSSSDNDTAVNNEGASDTEDTDVIEEIEDEDWDSSEATQIVLNGNSVIVNGSGATANGSIVRIASAGTYSLSGTLTDGQVIVDTEDEETVRLLLNGINIYSSGNAPIYVASAENTVIVLQEGAENYLMDGTAYIFEDSEDDEPDAALFSKSDLLIYGDGMLSVDANYNDGIKSKDGLKISSGTILVNAIDDGIIGKDYISVQNGFIHINAQGDGLKSTNVEAPKGYISIEGGEITINAQGDAIQAETNVIISGGEIAVSSGGGSSRSVAEDDSAKGIKAVVNVTIDGGTFIIDSADDAIHSNERIEINGGSFLISSGDDGIHADSEIEINGGDLAITKSYEGIESAVIIINDGNMHIVSSDDGINIAGGNDGSSTFIWPGGPNPTRTAGDYYLSINGGYIVVEADGDGVDANGSIEMTDGVVIINGPTNDANGAIDYDASFKISGGFIVGAGSSGMAQAPDQTSTQYSVLINFTQSLAAGTLVHLETIDGEELLSFSPTKKYQSIAFSSPELENGATYDVYYGGTSTGTLTDGLYKAGFYTPGTRYASFAISRIVTNVR